jgi:hypothetical protein
MARLAFGEDVLTAANLPEPALREALEKLGGRIRDIIDRTAKQVSDLRQALERYYHTLQDRAQGNRAADLVGRLLGIPTERRGGDEQADDRSGGYPLRRFAEAGLLPGYEFPIEPASLRLMGDPNEEEAVTVARPFGIGQFQPDSPVFARTKRWRVCGLDQSSPWNPRTDAPGLTYRVCRNCHLRFDAQRPACPRCRDEQMNQTLSGYAFGGFLAKREESPVLNEEDRIPGRNTVRLYPQWDGEAVGRWSLSCGWPITLWRNERVFWLNEGRSPSIGELEKDVARLHNEGKGFLLCGSCGSILTIPDKKNAEKGRKKVAKGKEDPCGHRVGCQKAGQPPSPIAIYTEGATEILRLIVPIPPDMKPDQHRSWGLSLGYALRTGMRQFYMLDGTEIEFELEGPWTRKVDGQTACYVGLSFIDPSLGGTGYLTKAAGDFDQIAQRAIEHLRHADCEKACYRCLKTYANQRVHELLNWPLAINTLEALAADKPTAVKLELGDTHDPRPWLEAYAAGVGSPLELKFLRLFEQNGFHPAKQVEIAVPDGSTPITIADFAVPERRLAIYVDGASIHLGHVARRDRLIRSRLQKATPPWRVVELRAADLGKGAVLVESLKKG